MTQAARWGRVWCGLTNSVTTVCSTSMEGRKSTTSWGRRSTRMLTSISGPWRSLRRQVQWLIQWVLILTIACSYLQLCLLVCNCNPNTPYKQEPNIQGSITGSYSPPEKFGRGGFEPNLEYSEWPVIIFHLLKRARNKRKWHHHPILKCRVRGWIGLKMGNGILLFFGFSRSDSPSLYSFVKISMQSITASW